MGRGTGHEGREIRVGLSTHKGIRTTIRNLTAISYLIENTQVVYTSDNVSQSVEQMDILH